MPSPEIDAGETLVVRSRPLYTDALRIVPGGIEGGDSGFLVEAMVPGSGDGAPYQTALALSALGPAASKRFQADEWAAMTQRLKAATASAESLNAPQNAAPRVYAAYEIAWANLLNPVLSDDESTALARALDADELLTRVGDRAPDLGDVAVTLTTLRLLGAEDAAAIEAASALVTTWREALCTPGGAGAPSFALAAGIADQVALPCSASEVDQQWDHLVDGARATAEPTADPLDAAIALHNLSMAQEGLWPDDAGKRALVEAALTRWLARGDTVGPVQAMESLPLVQKVAHRFGVTPSLTGEQASYLTSVARNGTEPARQVMVGRAVSYPFLDARLLGVAVATPPGFPAGMAPAENVAAALGRGGGIATVDTEQVADVVREAKPEHVLGVLAPLVLTLGDDGCALPGVLDAVAAAIPAQTSGVVGPDGVAVGLRALQQCGRTIDPAQRDSLVAMGAQIKADDPQQTTLEAKFIATTILCALEPDEVDVGPAMWDQLQRFAVATGGATDGSGFVDLVSTHQLLTIIESDRDTCRSRGVLGVTS